MFRGHARSDVRARSRTSRSSPRPSVRRTRCGVTGRSAVCARRDRYTVPKSPMTAEEVLDLLARCYGWARLLICCGTGAGEAAGRESWTGRLPLAPGRRAGALPEPHGVGNIFLHSTVGPRKHEAVRQPRSSCSLSIRGDCSKSLKRISRARIVRSRASRRGRAAVDGVHATGSEVCLVAEESYDQRCDLVGRRCSGDRSRADHFLLRRISIRGRCNAKGGPASFLRYPTSLASPQSATSARSHSDRDRLNEVGVLSEETNGCLRGRPLRVVEMRMVRVAADCIGCFGGMLRDSR